MAKPFMSVPVHRRPGWAKNVLRYNAVMNQTCARAGKPGEDYGVDNFSYDPANVGNWQLPDHIVAENLPSELCEAAKDWTLAGAAIDTALERIRDLEDEAVQRAYPSYTHEHLISSRREPEQIALGGGISQRSLIQSDTSASTTGSSISSPPKLDTSIDNRAKKTAHPNQLPDSITSAPGMESPPFTPVTHSGSESGSGARSPAMLLSGHMETAVAPDFVKLSAQLSPLMSPSKYSLTSTPPTSSKLDTLSWNNYLNAYANELNDLNKTALPRLKGYASIIHKTLFELRAHPPKGVSWQTAEAVFAFAEWWKDAKGMVQQREELIKLQELPRAEEAVAGAGVC